METYLDVPGIHDASMDELSAPPVQVVFPDALDLLDIGLNSAGGDCGSVFHIVPTHVGDFDGVFVLCVPKA
jgi:hypothetical protein